MWWLIGGGYALVGVLTALVYQVIFRTHRPYGPTEDEHAISVMAGVFWPLTGALLAVLYATRSLGRLAQQIADRIPAWRRKLKEMKEEIR